MTITRDLILETLKNKLESNDKIHAFWLEGSDGTNNLDDYSDIDMVFDVEDGWEESILKEIEDVLCTLGELDLLSRKPQGHPKLRSTVMHLSSSPDTLLLDIDIQSHSRDFYFTVDNNHEVPKVIFDKAGVIKYKNLDRIDLTNYLKERICCIENSFKEQIRVIKYCRRGKFLEAFGYYHKYILQPLVELLRIRHTPIISDYYIVHISDNMPEEIVLQLEDLFKVTSTEEILTKLNKANTIYCETLKELKL